MERLRREGDIEEGRIPYLNLESHPRTNQVVGPNLTDSGGWCYDSATGRIRVDCTHLGLEGTQISSW